MYDYIKGIIEEITPAELILDCGGIGYRLEISLNSYQKFRELKETKAYIYQHLREDEETLYGFFDKNERWIFTHLISVSGIGPNTARMMLSSLTPEEVCAAIDSGDVNKIKSVKGIGLKTAQKIIIELKDKIAKGSNPNIDLGGPVDSKISSEATSALISLGFTKNGVEKVVSKILSKNPDLTLEEVIKNALKQL